MLAGHPRSSCDSFPQLIPAGLQIIKSPSVLLSDMEGSSLGVWVAHGEGRALIPETASKESILEQGLAPVRYVVAITSEAPCGVMPY